MLFIGFQFVVWSITGTYMVIFDIDYIHGDSLVVEQQEFLENDQINYSIAELYAKYPKAQGIELTRLIDDAVYRFNDGKNKYLLNASTGESLAPISEAYAALIAKNQFNNSKIDINSISLIKQNPPFELSARHLPVWRVDFDDFSSASFYISVESGELVTKRHTFWRVFDWMFSFHVMDYVEEDPSNKLLLVFVILSLIASAFGIILTYYTRLKKDKNGKNKLRALA
jgi:hypothetical protein